MLLTNIKQFGDYEVVLLFSKHDDTVPKYLSDKYGCSVFVYDDERDDGSYISSIRPYLWWRYLSEDQSRENETYFFIDSDIIFREMVDFATLGFDDQTWVGSDCSGYLDYNYLKSCQMGEEVMKGMADITGITVDDIKKIPGAGAQWVITNPTADYWLRVYEDCKKLYHYLNPLNTSVQKWTAEMWAMLYGIARIGKTVKIAKELEFCWATDDIKRWDETKIMHNAGVVGPEELFFKGAYVDSSPFDVDLSYVDKSKVSSKYVEAINMVKQA